MEKKEKPYKVVCFGEVLWDIFPAGKKIGGAPFNVAYHLNRMGIDARMISCVGTDELGEELIQKLKEAEISTNECQVTGEYDTGTVIAEIDENNEPGYTIVEPVAWDYIRWKEEYKELVSNSQAFVFGSLGARNEISKQTLLKLLEVAPYKVFDINLRPPFISPESVIEFMKKADLVKLNEAELKQLLKWLNKEYTSEEEAIRYIREYFNLQGVIITKGSKGAVYHDKDHYLISKAILVQVKDTVGSGDSFLAGFLAKRAKGFSIKDSLDNAIALGAFITGQEGACPEYNSTDFIRFKEEKSI